jgi:Fis family transcriptional regulator
VSRDSPDKASGPLDQVSISSAVSATIGDYLRLLEDEPVNNLYGMVLDQVEPALLRQVMAHVDQNQSKASLLLGVSRGTLRSKLSKHGLL